MLQSIEFAKLIFFLVFFFLEKSDVEDSEESYYSYEPNGSNNKTSGETGNSF